jgi:hypothetical protein
MSDERSKFAEVTKPERAAEAFFFFIWINRLIICLNKTKQPFKQPFTVLVSQGQLAKNSKKIRKFYPRK